MDRVEEIMAGVTLVVGLLLGLAIGYALWFVKPATAAPETVAAGFTQADNSKGLPRVPLANPGPPPHIIPPGYTEQRRISVTVKPAPHEAIAQANAGIPAGPATSGEVDCPPVTLDLSLVTGKDGSRVIASSPDGTVTGGIDIPIVPPPKTYNHFALAIINPQRTAYTAIVGEQFHVFGYPVGVGAGLQKPEQGKAGPVLALQFQW